MATWEDRLRVATLNGVAFEVEDHTSTHGRTVVSHVYPDRDDTENEDTGRNQDTFEVSGFVIGPQYMEARDALKGIVRKGGTLRLVHPFYGDLQVRCTSVEIGEHKDALGKASLRFAFLEESVPEAAVIVTPTSADVVAKGDVARAAVKKSFVSRFNALSQLAYVTTEAVKSATAEIDRLNELVYGPAAGLVSDAAAFVGAVAEFKAAIDDLISTPGELADRFQSVLEQGRDLVTDTISTGLSALGALRGLLSKDRDGTPVATVAELSEENPFTAIGDQAVFTNTQELMLLNYRLALIEYALEAGGAPFAFQSVEDAEAVSNEIVSALDNIIDAADDPDLYQPLTDLRGATFRAIDETVRTLPRRRTYTQPGTACTVFHVAHEVFGDALRVDEVLSLNRILHPLMLGPEPVNVVTPS